MGTKDNFSNHPAYNWSRLNTTWNEEERQMFAVYSNGFRKKSGEFSQPVDFMAHWFRQNYLGNW